MKNLVVRLGMGMKLKIPKKIIDLGEVKDNNRIVHTSGAPSVDEAIKYFQKMGDGELRLERDCGEYPFDYPALKVKVLKKDGQVNRIDIL